MVRIKAEAHSTRNLVEADPRLYLRIIIVVAEGRMRHSEYI